MSCFLGILRWILFCGEDETRYDRSSSSYSYDRSSLYSSTTLSSSSSSSRQTSSQSSSPYRSYYRLDDSPPKSSPFTSSSPQTKTAVQPQPSFLASSSVQTQRSAQPQPAAKPSPFSQPSKSSSSSSLPKPSPFPPILSVRVIESQPSVFDSRCESLLKRHDLLKASSISSTSSSKLSPSSPTSVSQTLSERTTTSSTLVTPPRSSSSSSTLVTPPRLLSALVASPQSLSSSSALVTPPQSSLSSSSALVTPPQSSLSSSSALVTPPRSSSSSPSALVTPPRSSSSSTLVTPPWSSSSSSALVTPPRSSSSALVTPTQSSSSRALVTPPRSTSSSSALVTPPQSLSALVTPPQSSSSSSSALVTAPRSSSALVTPPQSSSSSSSSSSALVTPPRSSSSSALVTPPRSSSSSSALVTPPRSSSSSSSALVTPPRSSSSALVTPTQSSSSSALVTPPRSSSSSSSALVTPSRLSSSAFVTPPRSSSSSSSSSSATERYEIPKDLEEQIKRDIVPQVLNRPLSPSTYADYFAALLYAEDFYIEKWSEFILPEVTLELKRREDFETKRENKKTNDKVSMEKNPFVAFDIDKIPERLPYLLSRDFVFVKRVGKSGKPFKGILFRVVKSKRVLVDFGNDFHSQHSSSDRYDVSFSFNRVCLKRAHQAVSAAKDHSLHDFLFPEPGPNFSTLVSQIKYNQIPNSTVRHILNHKGPQPYLIEGPLSVLPNQNPNSHKPAELSAMGKSIQEAILKIYLAFPNCRVLICTPTNKSCDALMWSLHKGIPPAELFRANAAFRDYELVPDDIIPQCLYEGECFTCPSLSELRSFKVISSTYMSSFRLHNAGIDVKHFTHIFLVDASSAVEPEVVVPLASFAGGKPVVVVTGSSHNSPHWVRSDIARNHGLKRSYFERLLEREPYKSAILCLAPIFEDD